MIAPTAVAVIPADEVPTVTKMKSIDARDIDIDEWHRECAIQHLLNKKISF